MTLLLEIDVKNASPNTDEHKKHLIEMILKYRPNIEYRFIEPPVDNSK